MADVPPCQILLERCQKVGSRWDYGFEYTPLLERVWEADKPFGVGTRVRPATIAFRRGIEFDSSGGQTNGKAEPKWPQSTTPPDNTVQDGSILWSGVTLSYASLFGRIALSGSVWTVPVDVTMTGADIIDQPGRQMVFANFRSTVPGIYDIVNTTTITDTKIFVGVLRLTIEE